MTTPEQNAGGGLKSVIDQIWTTYDVDNSGELDRDETRKFVE